MKEENKNQSNVNSQEELRERKKTLPKQEIIITHAPHYPSGEEQLEDAKSAIAGSKSGSADEVERLKERLKKTSDPKKKAEIRRAIQAKEDYSESLDRARVVHRWHDSD